MIDHKHRWRIAEPDGRTWLPAHCACGANREFRSVPEDLRDWNDSFATVRDPNVWAPTRALRFQS